MKLPANQVRLGILSGMILMSLSPLKGQNATTSPAAEGNDVISLSEFRVDTSKDKGYLASNATTGTRLNTPIKELPMQLEVVTRDLLEDIGAVDFKEGLIYSSGVVQESVQLSNNFMYSPSGTGQSGANTLNPDGTALNIRGYNTRFVLRNGFRLDSLTDTINVGRQELVRGPQALLYGVSALGGIVNVQPRIPTGRRTTQIRLGLGSDDFRRAEIYTAGTAVKSGDRMVTFGVGAVYNHQSDYTDFNDRERLLVTPTIEWRISKKADLLLDMELGRFKTTGNGFRDVDDIGPGNLINELGLAVNNRNLFNETLSVARNRWGKGKEFRWSGEDIFTKDNYANVIAQLSARPIEGLELLAGVNLNKVDRTQRTIDSQGTDMTSSANAPTAVGVWYDAGLNPLNPAQRMWKTVRYQWAAPFSDKTTTATRLEANYTFSVLGNRQSILAGRQDTTVKQNNQATAMVTRNDGGDGNRSYISYSDTDYITYKGEKIRPWRDTDWWEWNTGHYVVYQGRLWNERINAVAGYRWDRYMVRQLDYTYVKQNAAQPDSDVANWKRPDSYDASANSAPGSNPVKNGYRFGGKTQYEENPNGGINIRITSNLNLFAMRGQGVFPNTGQRDGANNPFQAEKTKGTDIGLKADLWKDSTGTPRVSLQLGAYRIDRQNAVYNLFWAPQPRSNDRARPRNGVPAGGYNAIGSGPNAYSVYSSGFSDFETSKPVTYLLPVQYIAASDVNHPSVTGAPQQNGFILVDYASLANANNAPLKRAMDAAASDAGNKTALASAATGSGATGLYANNAYALNRNSDVPYNDRTEGADLDLILNITENYTAKIGYSYTRQEVLGGFNIVDQPKSTEYDSWWNYMGTPLETRRQNLNEAAYDFSGTTKGIRTIDAPLRQFTLWNKYTFRSGILKGADIGLGGVWRSERQAEIPLNNGASGTANLENIRLKPNYPSDIKINMALGYRMKLLSKDLRLQLNVNNLLNDQKDEAYSTSTLWINPATGTTVSSTNPPAGVTPRQITVPERSVIYYAPISFRFTATLAF